MSGAAPRLSPDDHANGCAIGLLAALLTLAAITILILAVAIR